MSRLPSTTFRPRRVNALGSIELGLPLPPTSTVTAFLLGFSTAIRVAYCCFGSPIWVLINPLRSIAKRSSAVPFSAERLSEALVSGVISGGLELGLTLRSLPIIGRNIFSASAVTSGSRPNSATWSVTICKSCSACIFGS